MKSTSVPVPPWHGARRDRRAGLNAYVRLTVSSPVPRGFTADVVGAAPAAGGGTRGTLACVFLDKVTSFAASHRLLAAHVLAGALAHEIGHLPLPPGAHRPDSVMRELAPCAFLRARHSRPSKQGCCVPACAHNEPWVAPAWSRSRGSTSDYDVFVA